MSVHLIHTAEIHRESFERLRDEISPGTELVHHVQETWLARARDGVGDGLYAEIFQRVKEIEGPVLCTCSTIGPIAEAAGALRIDWPMMQAAVRADGPVLLVYCLESTLKPSLALLQRAMSEKGAQHEITCLCLSQHWFLFEAGKIDQFAIAISASVDDALSRNPNIVAVVLAQASMAGAAKKLRHLRAAVLSSPKLALKAILALDEAKAS